MGFYNAVGSRDYDTRSYDICIVNLADLRGNNIKLYTLPSLDAIKKLQQHQTDLRVTDLLSKWDDLCRRDIKNMVPVRYNRETRHVSMPKSYTQGSKSREVKIEVVSEYDNLINALQGVMPKAKAKGSEIEAGAPAETAAPAPNAREPEAARARAPVETAVIVEQSEEEEAEMQAQFKELVAVIHSVSVDTLKQKKAQDKDGVSIMFSQAPRTEGRSKTQAQHNQKRVDAPVSDTYPKIDTKTTTRKRERDQTSPVEVKRKKTEKLTADLDEDARLRQSVVKKDQQKKEIQQDKSK
jgi:hypothetical protein